MMLGLTMAVLGVLIALVGASTAGAVTQTFDYTGTQETFTVPAGVTSLAVTAIGGKGGTPEAPQPTHEGGIGATVTANLAVNPRDVLDLIVAGDGANGHCDDLCPNPGPSAGGFGGGGESPEGHTEFTGSGGGGATSIRDSEGLLLVAGGGGGSGSRFGNAAGGAAGSAGENSVCDGEFGGRYVLEGGGAGTSVAGGMGGISFCNASSSGGDGQSFFNGISGGSGGSGGETGGGGGGGYWGGGGGAGWNCCKAGTGAGGGGGSSLVPAGGTAGLDENEAPSKIEISWTYPGPSPTVVTEAASAITQTSATLNATVNPNGEEVSDCHFQYGTSALYGSSVPCSPSPGAGESPVPVSSALTGLSENHVYHYRTVATNSAGTSYGSDHAFSTFRQVAGAPLIDGEASAREYQRATARLSTNAAGDLLVAFVASGRAPNGGETSVVSGGGVRWTLVARENAGQGAVEVWTARATGVLNEAQIAATLEGEHEEALTVLAFTGASDTGSFAGVTSEKGPPKGTLTASQKNSWVFAVGDDWLASTPRTPGLAQSLIHESPLYTNWVQCQNLPTSKAGRSVKINDTAPKKDPYDLLLIEVTPQSFGSAAVDPYDRGS